MDAKGSRETVLIVSAGCAAGGALAEMLATRGAQVIVADHAERRAMALARRVPLLIESLALDPLRPSQCRRFGDIWGDTPLDLLVHLHPLRSPRRLGAAVAAIPALTRALGPGLARGEGLVLVACHAPGRDAPPETHAFDAAFMALAPHMQAEAGGRARVNLLRLGQGAGTAALAEAVQEMAAQGREGLRGAVIDLPAQGD